MTVAILLGALSAWLAMAPAASPRRTAEEHARTGVGLYENGHADLAEGSLKDAINADPTYARAYLLLGQVHHRARELASAVKAFEAGLARREIDANTAAALEYELGAARLKLAENEPGTARARAKLRRDALASLQRAVKANPLHYQAHYYLAWQHDLLDEPAKANAEYRKCLETEPRYAPCYLGLGEMYVDYGHAERGLRVLETGLRPTVRLLGAGLG